MVISPTELSMFKEFKLSAATLKDSCFSTESFPTVFMIASVILSETSFTAFSSTSLNEVHELNKSSAVITIKILLSFFIILLL